jgi:DNA-binding transcriptional regulator/RsmH inhibitor MraZ
MEVKEIIPNLNKIVVYNGSEYTLTGSTIRKDKQGRVYYSAELLDKNKNSVCIVSLEGVEIWNEKNTNADIATS